MLVRGTLEKRAAQTEMSARLKTSWLAGQKADFEKTRVKGNKSVMRWLSKQLKGAHQRVLQTLVL